MASTLTLAGNADFNGNLDVDGVTNLDNVDIDGVVDMASTLTLAGNADFNADLDVDGTTNLDAVDIDGAVDMASTLSLIGNADFDGDLDVDGTTNLDAVNIDGAISLSGTALTASADEINILDGVTSTTAELNLLDGSVAGTAVASKALIADANLDIAGLRNITLTGELDSGSLDISGNADVDGTLSVGSINDIEATINSISAGTSFGAGSLGVTVANIGIGENALTDDNLSPEQRI